YDVRVRRMRCQPIDHGVWLDRKISRAPGFASVARALDRADFAGDRIAVADQDHVRIVGLDRDPAAVGYRVALTEFRKPMQTPGLSVVLAAPDAVGSGREDFELRRGA